MPWGLSCSASLLCVWNKDHNCAHCCTWRFLTVLIFQTCVVYLHEKEVPPSVRICEEQNHHPPDIQHAVPFRIESWREYCFSWAASLDMTCLDNRSGLWTPRFFVFLFTGQSLISPFHCLMHPGSMGALSLETRIVIWCETINTDVLKQWTLIYSQTKYKKFHNWRILCGR